MNWKRMERFVWKVGGTVLTVGQRKKVTAVTFFRCPTVVMISMKSTSYL